LSEITFLIPPYQAQPNETIDLLQVLEEEAGRNKHKQE